MCECEDIGPKIVNLGSIWRGLVNFTPLPFYFGKKRKAFGTHWIARARGGADG